MKPEATETGAKSVLGALRVGDNGKLWTLIHVLLSFTGWLLLLIVFVLFLLSPALRADSSSLGVWFVVFFGYEILLEVLSRTKKAFYETNGFRIVRIQVMLFLGSTLIFLTGGVESYFWFFFLWPLFATALYTSWSWTWAVYCETVVLYLFVSLGVAGGLSEAGMPVLLANLLVLLVVAVVLRLFVDTIKRYQTAQGRIQYYQILDEVKQSVESAVDLQSVLDVVLQTAVRSVDARDGTLMLFDEKDELRFRARFAGSIPGKADRTFKRGEGVAGYVVESRRPYVCLDTKTDPHFTRIIDGPPIGSLVCVPIISHRAVSGVILGVINVDSAEIGRFSEADAELLLTLADQAAVAIERADLLEGLREVGEEVRLGGPEAYQIVVNVASRLLRCPVALWRVNSDSAQVVISANVGLRPEYAERRVLDFETSIVGQVITTAIHENVFDIASDRRVSEETKTEAEICGWKSLLIVPLLTRSGEAAGALSIYSSIRRHFSQWEVDLLRTFANQAASAIQNALAYEQIQRLQESLELRVLQLEALTEVGQTVSNLGIDKALDVIYAQMNQIMDLSQAQVQIALYNASTDEVTFPFAAEQDQGVIIDKVRWGNREPEFRTADTNDIVKVKEFQSRKSRTPPGLTEYVIHKRGVLFIDQDFGQRASELGLQFWPKFGRRQRPTYSWLGVPMVVQDRVVGAISVQSLETEYAFNQDHIDLLSAMANQAAVVIENSRLLDRERQWKLRFEALSLIGLEIASSLEIDPSLDLTIAKAVDVAHADFSTLFIYDTREARFSKGIRKGLITNQPSLPGNDGFAASLIKTGEEVFVEDARSERRMKRTFVEDKEIASFAAVPLLFRGKAVGVLFVNYLKSHIFADEEKEIIRLLARYAATAITNASLYSELKDAYDNLKKAKEQELWAELGKTAGSLAHRIGNKGGIVRACATDIAFQLRELGVEDELLNTKLDMIQRNVDYLLEMSDLLFKPIEASKADLGKTDLALVLADALNSIEIPNDVEIRGIAGLSDLPQVPANSFFVEVFVELISNAVTAMKSVDEKVLTISGQVVKSDLEIRISDTGPGIPPSKQRSLFDLFTRISDEDLSFSKHRGFGLWWVKSFLVNIGGEIDIETDPGTGTSFIVKIPTRSRYN